jgi:hypothetical protein
VYHVYFGEEHAAYIGWCRVDHLCRASLILPTGSERGEEQGIRGVRLNGAAVRDSENLRRAKSDGDLRKITLARFIVSL